MSDKVKIIENGLNEWSAYWIGRQNLRFENRESQQEMNTFNVFSDIKKPNTDHVFLL
jgi:hypothetical protein